MAQTKQVKQGPLPDILLEHELVLPAPRAFQYLVNSRVFKFYIPRCHTRQYNGKFNAHTVVLLFNVRVFHQFGQIAKLQIRIVQNFDHCRFDVPSEHIELTMPQINHVVLVEEVYGLGISVPVGEAQCIRFDIIRQFRPVSGYSSRSRDDSRARPRVQPHSHFCAYSHGAGRTLLAAKDCPDRWPRPFAAEPAGSGSK